MNIDKVTPLDSFWREMPEGSQGRTRAGILLRVVTNTESTRVPGWTIEASYLDRSNRKGLWDGELDLIAERINVLCPQFWDEYPSRYGYTLDQDQQKNVISLALRDLLNEGRSRHAKPKRSRR